MSAQATGRAPRIVAGVDGSESSIEALRWAGDSLTTLTDKDDFSSAAPAADFPRGRHGSASPPPGRSSPPSR